MKRIRFLCFRVSVISVLAVLAVSCGVHEQTLHYDRPAALHYLYEAASTKLVRKTHVDIMNKIHVNIYPAGLHSQGSGAILRYNMMEQADRFAPMNVAFDQEDYRVNEKLEIIQTR